jgi:ABC-type multidrug transport system fused ATPase/permease subunit
MIEFYRKVLSFLDPQERRRVFLLFGMILVMGLIEVMGVASIVPFMYVMTDPGIVETNPYLARAYHGLGFTETRDFMLFLGIVVFLLVVFGLLFKALTQYAIYRFSTMRNYSISTRMLKGYLHQPYTWFLHRNSADVAAAVLTQVNELVGRAILPSIRFLASSIVIVFLVLLLVVAQPMVALTAALVLGTAYGAIYFGVRRFLARLGVERHDANRQRFRVAAEATGGIKDLKLMGLENVFLRRYQREAKRVAERDAMIGAMSEVPRYVLEAIAFGGLMFFVLFLLMRGEGTLLDIIPILALYAFAAVRLFPALQQAFAALSSMQFGRATLDRLHQDFEENAAAARSSRLATPPLRLTDRLELADVSYAYPQADRGALHGLDLTIQARTTVGIVGGTGAGKTTAVDLILGLLVPDRGEVRVDGTAITPANLRAWQRSIGYVPQQIFLTDDSVTANIAFGLEAAEIDPVAVERAARIAELHDFVTRELPQGYDTIVGERGVRLSGGQRQRIGIARALYHDPDVLILDEATSALDNLTERAVMDAVRNLGGDKTVIMIAHRLTTVRDCDVIFMLDQGRLSAAGSYDDLLRSSGKFRALAGGVA